MFFATILAAPLLAGVAVGLVTTSKRVPLVLTAVCIGLGIAGAVATAIDSETTDRPAAIAFALVAGVVAALLACAGWYAGREGRRRTLSRPSTR